MWKSAAAFRQASNAYGGLATGLDQGISLTALAGIEASTAELRPALAAVSTRCTTVSEAS